MIHHQWPLDVTDVMSIGFFVRETPTYKLSSTFGNELRTLIAKKANIRQVKIPKFQVALTQRQLLEMHVEELLSKVFMDSKANDLNFIYYKQRHVHLPVFFKAIQKQRLHEQSYHIVAVEGIHPNEVFEFEVMLRQQFPEIENILPTYQTPLILF
jgi:hypothetical protein